MSRLSKIKPVHAKDTGVFADIFNNALNAKEKAIYCFLVPGITIDDEALNKIELIFNDHPEVMCVYTDHITNHSTVYYPSYTYTVCDKANVNTPLCCRSEVLTRFNPNARHLCYWKFLKDLAVQYIAWHVPEPLFTIEGQGTAEEIYSELQRLK